MTDNESDTCERRAASGSLAPKQTDGLTKQFCAQNKTRPKQTRRKRKCKRKQEDAIRLEPSDTQKCISKGKSEAFECRNHIKVIQPISKSAERLYVCGTNAYNPRDYLLQASNLSLLLGGDNGAQLMGVGAGAQAECPFDPEDNSTAIWVERGNPSDAPALYTGTATDFNKADPLIFRTELYNQTTGQKVHEAKRTTKYDSKWLDSEYLYSGASLGQFCLSLGEFSCD